MLISKNWLSKYVDLQRVPAEELAEKFKMSTVEIEGVTEPGENMGNIVVGLVKKAENHPNADKLKVCVVDIGGAGVGAENFQPVQVVCGGSNVREGMLVAFAKVGAKVRWHGEGELVELKPAKIRGVDSRGMICASTEIGLGEMFPLKDEKEILDLSSLGVKPGIGLAEALGLNDAILEIDNKSLSNRPDLWGHYGMAREAAALFSKKLFPYLSARDLSQRGGGSPEGRELKKIKEGKEIKLNVKVEDAALCPRYMAVAVSGVQVTESPEWLKRALMAVGLRPINNIVDIANYVMMDLGQPMHAFSAGALSQKSKVKSQKSLIVRPAAEGERFVTLDGVERALDSSMLVIADEEKPVALAGVMGGLNSTVNETTETIIFESANFDAVAVRRTSMKLGLRSDSSVRFEKSLDPNLCELALRKAVELTLSVCPKAKVASKVADEAKFSLPTGPIAVPVQAFEQKLGVAVPLKIAVDILERLGFGVKEKKDELFITIPTWRATKDVSIAEDVVEEAARVYGYEKIPGTLPSFAMAPPEISRLFKLERRARDALIKGLGYTEVYNYSFVDPETIQKFGDDAAKYLELNNPVSKERPFIRRHLVHNLLENVVKNMETRVELRLMEIGKVYRAEEPGSRESGNGDELLPRQDIWLAAVYAKKRDEGPFWQARRVAEILSQEMGYEFSFVEAPEPLPWQHPFRCGIISLSSRVLGSVYELHPGVLENLRLDVRAAVAEINLSALAEIPSTHKKYAPLQQFPAVERDLAILVGKEARHEELNAAIFAADPLLCRVELFDVYEGKGLGEGYKSLAYHLTYRHSERTLTAAEADAAHAKIIELLKEKFGAAVR